MIFYGEEIPHSKYRRGRCHLCREDIRIIDENRPVPPTQARWELRYDRYFGYCDNCVAAAPEPYETHVRFEDSRPPHIRYKLELLHEPEHDRIDTEPRTGADLPQLLEFVHDLRLRSPDLLIHNSRGYGTSLAPRDPAPDLDISDLSPPFQWVHRDRSAPPVKKTVVRHSPELVTVGETT